MWLAEGQACTSPEGAAAGSVPICTCQDPDFLRFATLCVEYRVPDFVLRAVTSTVGAFIEKAHIAPRAQPGLQMPPEPRWPASVHSPPRPPSTWGSVPPVAPHCLCSACFSAATHRAPCHWEGWAAVDGSPPESSAAEQGSCSFLLLRLGVTHGVTSTGPGAQWVTDTQPIAPGGPQLTSQRNASGGDIPFQRYCNSSSKRFQTSQHP